MSDNVKKLEKAIENAVVSSEGPLKVEELDMKFLEQGTKRTLAQVAEVVKALNQVGPPKSAEEVIQGMAERAQTPPAVESCCKKGTCRQEAEGRWGEPLEEEFNRRARDAAIESLVRMVNSTVERVDIKAGDLVLFRGDEAPRLSSDVWQRLANSAEKTAGGPVTIIALPSDLSVERLRDLDKLSVVLTVLNVRRTGEPLTSPVAEFWLRVARHIERWLLKPLFKTANILHRLRLDKLASKLVRTGIDYARINVAIHQYIQHLRVTDLQKVS